MFEKFCPFCLKNPPRSPCPPWLNLLLFPSPLPAATPRASARKSSLPGCARIQQNPRVSCPSAHNAGWILWASKVSPSVPQIFLLNRRASCGMLSLSLSFAGMTCTSVGAAYEPAPILFFCPKRRSSAARNLRGAPIPLVSSATVDRQTPLRKTPRNRHPRSRAAAP